jgi:hypothetical protein
MIFHTLLQPTVGADLSRPAPIDRPLVDSPLSKGAGGW